MVEVASRGDSIVKLASLPCFHDDETQTAEPITITYVDSLCEAAVKLKWPGVSRWYRVPPSKQIGRES